MSLKCKFEKRYGEGYTLEKCREKECALRDVDFEKYFMVDGDGIKSNNQKSVDCIIVSEGVNQQKKHRLILCELTSGGKNIKDAIEKFQDSGSLIIDYLSAIDEYIFRIDCILLGKIIKNGKTIEKKELMRKFRISGHCENLIIQNEMCGYSIANLEINNR